MKAKKEFLQFISKKYQNKIAEHNHLCGLRTWYNSLLPIFQEVLQEQYLDSIGIYIEVVIDVNLKWAWSVTCNNGVDTDYEEYKTRSETKIRAINEGFRIRENQIK